jgi:hypothetical protein
MSTNSQKPLNSSPASGLRLASFRFDVTPPIGHSLCGGWIKPVVAIDDPLEAIGIVLIGAGKPIVICAVDWTGILNDAYVAWRDALAQAAGTTPDRVAVHCVHQHNAPFACLEAERLVAEQGDLPHVLDVNYFNECLSRGRKAVAEAIPNSHSITHIAHGQGKVDRVASNRRIHRDAAGHIIANRNSSNPPGIMQTLPEGLIDPWLKTVAFYDGKRKVAAFHYYATHPMSFYGDGRVTSDIAGLARKQRQMDEPDCTHVYFTGCAGNIAAGKYNDGTPEARKALTQRLYDGILASEESLKPSPIHRIAWKTTDILPPPRSTLSAAVLTEMLNNRAIPVVDRNRPALMLSWLRRNETNAPLTLSALDINEVTLLHLPAECFIEYQLRAQQLAPSRFVAVAAYGDDGPWYIPTAEEYPHGGYEVSVAFCDPKVDPLLTKAMEQLLC